ncbi:hypothetical protein F2Q69_00032238 [Brassica cretica]|uniref:Protein kinase domain-containing protein n=1 Tax=Brassica cretica TaxID=69181 RepID=A0A8S9S759_BRACR|nr:hypothetical protein F2Q69_00032238 [Brassica cretica]
MGSDASKLSLAKLLPQQVVAVLLAWLTNVAAKLSMIGQGMYISVFGAREPETGRILALKKARSLIKWRKIMKGATFGG